MAKAVEGDLIVSASGPASDEDAGMLPMFDLSAMRLSIPPDVGVDLEDILDTLLSESGSITPRTIKGECAVNEAILYSTLERIIDQQKQTILERMQELDARRIEILAEYRTVEAERESYEAARFGDDINLAKIKPEILEKVTQIRELEKVLDEIVKDYKALQGMMIENALEPEGPDLDKGKAKKEDESVVGSASSDKGEEAGSSAAGGVGDEVPIMLKTYQQDSGLPGSEDNIEVMRFALIAENLRGMAGQSLIADMLHPLEVVLMCEAINTLKTCKNPTFGVVCDIFVRVDNKISSVEDGRGGTIPETHCVALWKENDTLHLIDPSNSSFSFPVIGGIKLIWGSDDVVESIDGVLYGNGKKPVGRIDGTARDCIDIAVKIVLEMSYQTEVFQKKKSPLRFADTFAQLSTENRYAKHFNKGSDRQLRELTATSADIRHSALKVAKAIAGV